MRFFTVTDRTTADELRRHYKALCKQHHPDRGGSGAVQAQINVEYQQALKRLADIERQNGNLSLHDIIIKQIENHLNSIMQHVQNKKTLYTVFYDELKSRIPNKYHGLMNEFVKIVMNG